MYKKIPVNHLLLLFCCVIALWHPIGAVAGGGPAEAAAASCPRKYPPVKLASSCQPTPAWCKRLAARHLAQKWRRCKPSCKTRLRFGDKTYPVSWSATKVKLPMFGLALSGAWRHRSLTIWRGRLFARRRGDRWQVVYQVGGGKLVALDPRAKPPCRGSGGRRGRVAAEAAAGEKKKLGKKLGGPAHGLIVRCHGNECRVRLSVRELLRQAAQLLRRSRRRDDDLEAELRLVLAVTGSRTRSRARFVSGRLALVDAAGRRRRGNSADGDSAASEYRRFVGKHRQRYWRKEGWRPGAARARKGRKKAAERGRKGDNGERWGRRRDSRNKKLPGDRNRRGGGRYKSVDAFRERGSRMIRDARDKARAKNLFDFKDD